MRIARQIGRALTAAALASVAGACHDYRPLAGAAPAADGLVRVRLTEAGSAALAGYLGADVVAVTGRFEARTDSGIVLRMASSESPRAVPREWQGERVTVPAAYVAATETRRLSPLRTGIVTGAVVAALVGTRAALGGSGSAIGSRRGGAGPR